METAGECTTSIAPGSALVHVLRAHRQGWSGTICASPEHWNCGATEAFRVEQCAAGRASCPDLCAFRHPRPSLRLRTPLLVKWLSENDRSLDNQLLFLLSPSRRRDASEILFVQGVYRVGKAFVQDGVQAIIEPEGDDWTRFPSFAVPVRRLPWRPDDTGPGAVTEALARRWIDAAREAGRTIDPAVGWTESMRERLERFCNDRAAMVDLAKGLAYAGALDDLRCFVLDDDVGSSDSIGPGLDPDSEPDPEPEPEPEPLVASTLPAPPLASSLGAAPEDVPAPSIDASASDIAYPSVTPLAPWNVVRQTRGQAIGPDRLEDRLRAVSLVLGVDAEDLCRIDAFARAGEIVWLRGEGAERALRAYAHAVSGGAVHESPVGPTTLDVDDLWRDPVTRDPTGFARAWTLAAGRVDATVLVNLRTIDAGVMHPWLATLVGALRAPERPSNLLVVATSTETPTGAPRIPSVERWLVPIEPMDPASAPRVTAASLAATGAAGLERALAASATVLTGARASAVPDDVNAPWAEGLLARGDVALERIVRATALLISRSATIAPAVALAEAREWLDAATATDRAALPGGLGAGYRRLDTHSDDEGSAIA